MRLIILVMVLVLSGCAAKQYTDYEPLPSPIDPKGTIERVLTEQPKKFRPEAVDVQDEYVEYSNGSTSKGSVWVPGSGTKRVDVVRVYYTSIAENRLYKKGRWWNVRSVNKQGTLLGIAWTDDLMWARKYMAALDAMRSAQK